MRGTIPIRTSVMPSPTSTRSRAVLERISGSASSTSRTMVRTGRTISIVIGPESGARLAPGWSTGVSPPRKSAAGNVDSAIGGVETGDAVEPDGAASVLSLEAGPADADAEAGTAMHAAATMVARMRRVWAYVMSDPSLLDGPLGVARWIDLASVSRLTTPSPRTRGCCAVARPGHACTGDPGRR